MRDKDNNTSVVDDIQCQATALVLGRRDLVGALQKMQEWTMQDWKLTA